MNKQIDIYDPLHEKKTRVALLIHFSYTAFKYDLYKKDYCFKKYINRVRFKRFMWNDGVVLVDEMYELSKYIDNIEEKSLQELETLQKQFQEFIEFIAP